MNDDDPWFTHKKLERNLADFCDRVADDFLYVNSFKLYWELREGIDAHLKREGCLENPARKR